LDLIEWLEKRRGDQFHRDFARMLGWHPSKWTRLRLRQQAFTEKELGRVLSMYPSECAVVLAIWHGRRAA